MSCVVRRLLVLGSLAPALLACAAGPTYYGVRAQLDQRRALDAAPQLPTAAAAEVVGRASTVAFYPPDACREDKAAGPGATELSNVLRLQCGVLMSELEAEAARAGFSVVSWQTLRGGTGRPIDYARENHVDLLFEINELSLDIPPLELYAVTDLQFFQREHTAAGPSRPLVMRDVNAAGQRCQQRFLAALDSTVAVSLDLKMVSVADGRVHWLYRASRAESPGETLALTRTYEVPPLAVEDNVFTTLGTVGLGVGGGLALAGVLFWGISEPGDELKGVGELMVPIAGAVALASLPVLGLGLLLGGDVVYPEADTVVCQPTWAALEEKPAQASAPVAGSSVQLTAQTSLRDPVEARRKALLQQVIREFMGALGALKQQQPAPAAG